MAVLGLLHSAHAQSTTGGKSGGSTASTGTGYLTEGKRPAASSASSMTIADEGASRAYMYVPPTSATKAKNRAASPSGPDRSSRQPTTGKSADMSRKSARKQHS
jgi:hypothetical protein